MVKTFGKICEKIMKSLHVYNSYSFFPPVDSIVKMTVSLVSGHVGRRREKVCSDCISENIRCRKLILGRDIG